MASIRHSRRYCPRDTIRQAMIMIGTKRGNRELPLVLTEGNCLKARFLFKDLGYLANYALFFFIFPNRPVASKLA
jgi:hypothetical protein